jgi:acylphosphatase
VELEAEGEENLLRVFVQWCHRGPRNAVVNEVESENVDPKNFNAFEIKR